MSLKIEKSDSLNLHATAAFGNESAEAMLRDKVGVGIMDEIPEESENNLSVSDNNRSNTNLGL